MTKKTQQTDFETEGYTKAEEPTFVKFENIGDKVEGLVMDIENISVTSDSGDKNETERVTVQTKERKKIVFINTTHLSYLFRLYGIKIGTEIVAIYDHDQTVDRGIQKKFELYYR